MNKLENVLYFRGDNYVMTYFRKWGPIFFFNSIFYLIKKCNHAELLKHLQRVIEPHLSTIFDFMKKGDNWYFSIQVFIHNTTSGNRMVKLNC